MHASIGGMKEQVINKKRGNPNWGNGKSGNPKGRPPKGYSITEAFREMLASDPLTKQTIVSSIKAKAIAGDPTAQKLIWNYMDGMPPQALELGGPDGEKLVDENIIVKGILDALKT